MKLAAALLGLGLLSGATSARAEGMFGFFDKACLKTEGAGPAALALADGPGWSVMPPEMVKGLASQFGSAKTAFQGRLNASERRGVLVGDVTTSPTDGSIDLSFCVVVGVPTADESMFAEAATFAAVPTSQPPTSSEAIYTFTDDAGKHVQILHPEFDSVTLPLMKSGRMRVLIAMTKPQISLLAFARPAKSPN